MATITPKVAVLGGVSPLTYVTASAGGDVFDAQPGNRYLIHVKNGHTSTQSINIDDPTSVGPPSFTTFVPDVKVNVVNANEQMILINDAARFINSSGQIALTYPDGVVSLTLQVIRV